MTEYMFKEMHDNVDNEVFVVDMDEYPGYAIWSDGTVENTRMGRLMKPSKRGHGYYSTSIKNRKGEFKSVYIHRLVAQYFLKKPDEEMLDVDHINCDKLDNDYRNLKWSYGTYSLSKSNHNECSYCCEIIERPYLFDSCCEKCSFKICCICKMYSNDKLVTNFCGDPYCSKCYDDCKCDTCGIVGSESRYWITPSGKISARKRKCDLPCF